MKSRAAGGGDAVEWRSEELEAVLAEYEGPLLRYAARIVNNPTAAQDVVQNVFLKLVRLWKEEKEPSSRMKAWLYRVTHNEAVDFVRHEARLRNLHERHAEEKASREKQPMEKDDRLAVVLRHIEHLKPREQQVLLLRLQQGLSYREISKVTGRSEGNVGNILHHAVKKLSRRLKQAEIL